MKAAESEEDRRLLSKCFAGDRAAAEFLVEKFSNLVYRSIQQTLGVRHVSFDRSLLEDLHNTVFLQLFENDFKKLKQFKGKNNCSLATWIRVVSARIVLNHLRKRGFDAVNWQGKKVSFEDIPEVQSSTLDSVALLVKADQERLLTEGMRKLPGRSRLLMILHYKKGLALEDVASVMHITIQNAYTIKYRAIQKLKGYVTHFNENQIHDNLHARDRRQENSKPQKVGRSTEG